MISLDFFNSDLFYILCLLFYLLTLLVNLVLNQSIKLHLLIAFAAVTAKLLIYTNFACYELVDTVLVLLSQLNLASSATPVISSPRKDI